MEQDPRCADDLSEPLPAATRMRPGTPLRLAFEGWSVTGADAICGARSDLAFVAEPDPGCWEETRDGLGFTAPGPGDWAIAMPACAVGYTQFSANRICGTWYAAIDTR